MCLKDLLKKLHAEGTLATEPQIRWAITSGKVPRPPLDGSLRFDFGEEYLEMFRALFGPCTGADEVNQHKTRDVSCNTHCAEGSPVTAGDTPARHRNRHSDCGGDNG